MAKARRRPSHRPSPLKGTALDRQSICQRLSPRTRALASRARRHCANRQRGPRPRRTAGRQDTAGRDRRSALVARMADPVRDNPGGRARAHLPAYESTKVLTSRVATSEPDRIDQQQRTGEGPDRRRDPLVGKLFQNGHRVEAARQKPQQSRKVAASPGPRDQADHILAQGDPRVQCGRLGAEIHILRDVSDDPLLPLADLGRRSALLCVRLASGFFQA